MTDDTDTLELRPYLEAGWQLIPLHSHDYFDEYKGKRRERGKSPLHSNWTRRPYDSRKQVGHMEAGSNVGVRLRGRDLVVDVDPRNFEDGDDPFKRLCEDVGLDPSDYPVVETGSGGLHVYMQKPADASVRDSLEDYRGVEFKALGRQVVAAGSVHPLSKKTYRWDFLSADLGDVREAPARLLNLVRRPAKTAATGGGEHTQEEVAAMLDVLDPEDFRDHDAWLTLMQACHHASAGDARQEFVEWSTRDPEYVDEGGLIGRRWDSLHADAAGARVTFRTLHKTLTDAGHGDAIPRTPPEDDFDDDAEAPDLSIGPEHERLGPLERMNEEYCAVMEGSKFRVMHQAEDPTFEPSRKYWQSIVPYDFKMNLANRKIEKGDKVVPLADAWLEWGGRRSYESVVFHPEKEFEGHLNLWTGWSVEPKRGDWSMLEELVGEVLCDGDKAVNEYVLNWAAHMVQRPASPAEVALCFQGGKGVGKGTWGRALAALAGRHGLQITSSKQLTGRFNAHLRDTILLFADEAISPYDKESESQLKGLITEPTIAFEAKGKDIQSGHNYLHVVIASNEDWFVPMGLEGERRFLLQRANAKRLGQQGWFDRLNAQLKNGGLEALLFDLLNRDIEGWSPRNSIPTTRASTEQKIRGLDPVAQWWFNALRDGDLPFETTDEDQEWAIERVRAFKQDVKSSFEEHCRTNGIRSGASGRSMEMMFAAELKKLCPTLKDKLRATVPDERPDVRASSDGRSRCYELPSLAECRDTMDALLGMPMDWD